MSLNVASMIRLIGYVLGWLGVIGLVICGAEAARLSAYNEFIMTDIFPLKCLSTQQFGDHCCKPHSRFVQL